MCISLAQSDTVGECQMRAHPEHEGQIILSAENQFANGITISDDSLEPVD
ncbi:MAG TPA: hypothetical protein VGD98_25805 [Ktedonobacteraceae bacterium]